MANRCWQGSGGSNRNKFDFFHGFDPRFRRVCTRTADREDVPGTVLYLTKIQQCRMKEVPDAQRFGVAELRGNHVIGIEEKPGNPKSNYAVIGIYLYDKTVFERSTGWCPPGGESLKSPT